MTTAQDHKNLGNRLFANQEYQEAIKEYSIAIIKDSSVSVYYSNRAQCYKHLNNINALSIDAQKAIDLDPNNLKAIFLLASCSSPNIALGLFNRAYHIGITVNSPFIPDILDGIRRSKKSIWEQRQIKRLAEQDDLFAYLKNLIDRDRKRQMDQANDSDELLADIQENHHARIEQLSNLFNEAKKDSIRKVPDYLVGKINFEILTDPVITPDGITYDRPELIQHFNKIGYFDPITRKSIGLSDLIPNHAIREVVDEFLVEKGWAIDY